jgi:two-component sensor histidine kinase
MPFEQVLRIGIIANEMIVNSIKYGFDGTADAAIHMIFEEEESFYRFTYHDSNTRPVDTATLREGRSLGVRLIEMMVQQMDAQIDLNGQTGLHYTLRIPKDVH